MIPIRDENPTSTTPVVTVTVLVLCVVVFLWQLALGREGMQWAAYAFGVVPKVLFGQAQLPPAVDVVPPPVTVLTSMFLHGGWMHLIGNMLYLWIFGNNIEDSMGHGRFVAFYMVCGIAAALAQALPDPASTIPMIGASGAISGVLGAYLLLFPHARVLVMIPIGIILHPVHLPAVAVLGLWFALQLVNSLMTPAGQAGVAFGAHIGGFVAGMALVGLFKKRGVRFWQSIGKRY